MSDFIELTEVYEDISGYTQTRKITINKSLISEIEEDRHHDQSYITYQGKEIRVRETTAEINSKSAE